MNRIYAGLGQLLQMNSSRRIIMNFSKEIGGDTLKLMETYVRHTKELQEE